ncbi:MAG: phosphoribosylformylglycinamidine synthase subunit PurL [Candidatus Omnitrophica bacterium]|nr:phosphoribosylformylglycinamidine synthase subunit PurL [Candidatus Omnitrophota bacterium]MBU4472665.1 phosphoribosylformylglycinamidine synthase subunit PurL [Candidatus Omnitrophota bacterium]MCG2706704.1 phosphoribosylformylglycinamidine synthase subunit PurL [Candidatus Omnitrophota bacterium]
MSDNIVITKEIIEKQGLLMDEYEKIKKCLGREPNYTELGMFSAMWSEHCSYKNSKPVLALFPTKGKQVIQGPGENAGVVDIGDGLGVVFKIESHNHPSAVQPYEASATGGGGCVRDIFTMGARPIGLLDSLRLGSLKKERVKFLFKNIIKGFTDYANIAGIPVLGGEIYFDESYEGNPLVNAMTVGIVRTKAMIKARASGVNNLVLIVGGATGRDGVEGAAFASSGLDEEAAKKSSAVAIGDPRMGRILREACLELIGKGLVIGMQDMGAAGLICSTSETAYKANTGIEIDISLVPRKEEGMSAYEVMLSESQERMLVIIDRERLEEVKRVFAKWGVPVDVIGRVTDDGMVCVKDYGKVVARVPAASLVEAPVYKRKATRPKYLTKANQLNLAGIKEPKNCNHILLELLDNPTIASKAWVFKHGDPKVAKGVLLGPGSDAGVVAVPGTKKAIAVTTDCNATYCYLDPYKGGQIAVLEAARNLVCSGARPLAITDGINFGNPKNPEVFWQFRQAALGISEACRALNTPVVSGNVSFNNENPKGSVDPTPVVGMVGLIKDKSKIVRQYFKNAGDMILLLGKNKEELGGSEYLKTIHGLKKGRAPGVDLQLEKSVQKTTFQAIERGLVQSAHDCSEGGLAVSLAESCISNPVKKLGAVINLTSRNIRTDALLFGETQSRIVVSVKAKNLKKVLQIAKKNKTPVSIIGEVTGNKLIINSLINISVNDLYKAWCNVIENYLKD